jgi:hypothetical protein
MKNIKTVKDFIDYLNNLEYNHKDKDIFLYNTITDFGINMGHTTPHLYYNYPELPSTQTFQQYQDYEIDHIDPVFCDEGIALIKYRIHITVANS